MNARILLIAESDEILGAIPPIIESLGHDLTIVNDADAGAGIMGSNPPDLVLLDGLTGRFLASDDSDLLAARISDSHTPVIALTPRHRPGASVEEADPGEIRVFDYLHPPFDSADIDARIAAGLRTRRFQEDLKKAAALDPTTQMLNRQSSESRLAEEISRVIRYGRALAVVLMKIVPEPSEDEVLTIGRIFKERTRLSDVLCRWSQDAVLILLPETGPFGAVRVAENLRRSLVRHAADLPRERGLADDRADTGFEVFLGAAGFVEGDNAESLVARTMLAIDEARRDPRRPVVLARVSRGSEEVRFLAV